MGELFVGLIKSEKSYSSLMSLSSESCLSFFTCLPLRPCRFATPNYANILFPLSIPNHHHSFTRGEANVKIPVFVLGMIRVINCDSKRIIENGFGFLKCHTMFSDISP